MRLLGARGQRQRNGGGASENQRRPTHMEESSFHGSKV